MRVEVVVQEHYTDVVVQEHYTDVDVDPEDVLNEMDTNEIEAYLEKRGNTYSVSSAWDYSAIAESYYHGDFDLKKLLAELKMNHLAEKINFF
jgi:hypothetical protein